MRLEKPMQAHPGSAEYGDSESCRTGECRALGLESAARTLCTNGTCHMSVRHPGTFCSVCECDFDMARTIHVAAISMHVTPDPTHAEWYQHKQQCQLHARLQAQSELRNVTASSRNSPLMQQLVATGLFTGLQSLSLTAVEPSFVPVNAPNSASPSGSDGGCRASTWPRAQCCSAVGAAGMDGIWDARLTGSALRPQEGLCGTYA